jgi:hypothetical protein
MDKKVLQYGRGAVLGGFLGHTLYMVFQGDTLRSILESAAIYAVIGVGVVLIIELGLKRWTDPQP